VTSKLRGRVQNIMKRITLLAALLVLSLSICAQTRSINLELLGSSGAAGVNYDARFKEGNSGFGFSAGLGYGFAYSSLSGSAHQISVPAEINYLFGKQNSHLVLGVGVSGGVLFYNYNIGEIRSVLHHRLPVINPSEDFPKASFAYNAFLDIAYRLQKPKGFVFAVGFKPNLVTLFWPYLSFGYSF